jgi:hypothetical protein
MAKHSKGPWELDSAKDGDTRYYIVHAAVPDKINADFGYPVCDTLNRHHCISPDEDEANGKLLAAADAMADLLLRAYTHVTHGGPTRAELEAVLKKAGIID